MNKKKRKGIQFELWKFKVYSIVVVLPLLFKQFELLCAFSICQQVYATYSVLYMCINYTQMCKE